MVLNLSKDSVSNPSLSKINVINYMFGSPTRRQYVNFEWCTQSCKELFDLVQVWGEKLNSLSARANLEYIEKSVVGAYKHKQFMENFSNETDI